MPKEPDHNCARARMWRVIRRRIVFTSIDIIVPLDGVTYNSAKNFIWDLSRHGILRFERWSRKPGQPGYKVFRLIQNVGPVYPSICPNCGQPVQSRACEVKDDKS